jgi:hypothetical protein
MGLTPPAETPTLLWCRKSKRLPVFQSYWFPLGVIKNSILTTDGRVVTLIYSTRGFLARSLALAGQTRGLPVRKEVEDQIKLLRQIPPTPAYVSSGVVFNPHKLIGLDAEVPAHKACKVLGRICHGCAGVFSKFATNDHGAPVS